MWGQRLFQIIRSLVTDFHQQGCRLLINEGIDTFIHIVVTGDGPVESFCKCVERPKSCIVTLGSDDLVSPNQTRYLSCQIIGTSDVAT